MLNDTDSPFIRRSGAVGHAVPLAASLALMGAAAYAETKFRISVDTGPNHVRNITLRTFLEKI
jgi:hypothetical protein